MEKNIAIENATRLAALTTVFCLMNGIEMTKEIADTFALGVMAGIGAWYKERGIDFDPRVNAIEDAAIQEVFGKMQEVAILASISAQTGIGMEGFSD